MAQLYNLAPTWQENGLAYFFSRYVAADETPSHQKFDFVRDVWKPSSSASDAQIDSVLASMTAVGLMRWATSSQAPGLMDAARKSYGTALRLINHALQDPAEAVKDSTMLSILILGVFEMMSENTQRTMTVEAFQEHVKGAEALALMRGPSQFKTRAGRRMFSMLCQRVIISCVQRNVPVPDSLIELWHNMCQTAEAESPSRRFMPLLFQVLQVRSEIHSGFLSDPETIIDRLLAIDQDLEKLTAQLPPSWKYRAFEVKTYHPAVFGGICYLYSSLHHANVWNHILTTRILLLETVLSKISEDLASFCPTLDSTRYLDEYRKARRKLKHMVRDVTASVPQQLGLMNPADGSIGSADGDSAPISTVEIRETPSPPTSPSSRSSDSASAVYSPLSATVEPPRYHHHPHHASGLTLLDVTRARDAEDQAERYMLLVSATSTVVWPLFVAGMSSVCTAEMRGYVVERLRTLYMETGIRQADAVARLLEEHEMVAGVDGGDAEQEPGAEWLDLQLRGAAGQHGEMAVPGMGEEYGLGLLPIAGPAGVKAEFEMAWV
jgi:hypothetical protein